MYLIFVGCLVVFGWELNILYLIFIGCLVVFWWEIKCLLKGNCNFVGGKCLFNQGIWAFLIRLWKVKLWKAMESEVVESEAVEGEVMKDHHHPCKFKNKITIFHNRKISISIWMAYFTMNERPNKMASWKLVDQARRR